MSTFHWLDYIVFSISIFISLSIGIYYAISKKKSGTTEEYLMGGRQMSMVPVTISLVRFSKMEKKVFNYLYNPQNVYKLHIISIALQNASFVDRDTTQIHVIVVLFSDCICDISAHRSGCSSGGLFIRNAVRSLLCRSVRLGCYLCIHIHSFISSTQDHQR